MITQTKILKAIWGKQTGYVFIPRRNSLTEVWDEGRAYKYPDELGEINSHIEQSLSEKVWDMYWCPLVFDKPQRLQKNVTTEVGILWADLDEVVPQKLGSLKPSVAWQSSDDRYQALWLLDNEHSVDEIEETNKALTYKIGADKGGWDIGQVLRIPNTPNFKYNPEQQGKLLWLEPRKFSLASIALAVGSGVAATTETLENPIATIKDILKEWVVPSRIVDIITMEEDKVVVGERSEKLWEIETSLLEAGLPIDTVVEVVSLSAWNKFKGRKGELNQIYSEVLKADKHVKTKGVTPLEVVSVEDEKWAIPFETFTSMRLEKPSWLVEGIWQDKTYGIIAGEPKTYKSVQATDLALSVASGKAYLGHFPVHKTGAVLYVQEENNEQTVQDRVFKIANSKNILVPSREGWTLPHDLPLYFSNNFGIDLTDQKSRDLLEQTIQTLKPILLILDPLYMMLGNVDENSATEVGAVLRWLTYLRNAYGLSIVVCHHYNKGNSQTRGGQRVRGSSAFHAWVESALYVKATTELFTVDVEREFRAYPTMPELTLRMRLGNPGELAYFPEVLNSGDDNSMEITQKMDEVCELLDGTPLTEAEIAEKLRATPAFTKRVLALLVDGGKVARVAGGGRGIKVTYILKGGSEK